jgi:Haemolymph juvenile hormone binding protein (JHBP)
VSFSAAEMKVCARNSPERDECLKEAIEVFFHTFYAGIEALNVPSFDPYVTEDEHFEYNQSTIRGVLNIKQAKALGLSNTRVVGVRSRATDEKFNLEIDLMLPSLVLEGSYRGEGQVNAMQMSGKGFFNMSFTDVRATFKLTGELTTLNGEDFMKIVRFNLVPEGGKMKLYATGIFPDPQISESSKMIRTSCSENKLSF